MKRGKIRFADSDSGYGFKFSLQEWIKFGGILKCARPNRESGSFGKLHFLGFAQKFRVDRNLTALLALPTVIMDFAVTEGRRMDSL